MQNKEDIIEHIESNPHLYKFLKETELVVPNCYIDFYTMKEYELITGINRRGSHYAFCHVFPLKLNTPTEKKYCAAIVVADDGNMSDIAHELCHLYIHGKLGYPWPWLDNTFEKVQETKELVQQAFYATRIYDSAVHPIIDQILQDRSLLDTIIFHRMYKNYSDDLAKYLRSPNNSDKYYIFTRTIELQKRLPSEMIVNINKEFGTRNSYSKLLSQIQHLPKYPDSLNPDSVYQYILEMWKEYGINSNSIYTKLLKRTPLLII